MHYLINFFLKRPVVVNLITLLVLIAGTLSVISLQKETFQKIDFGVVVITTVYPGSSSEDVEKLVTIPIEREIRSVSGIKDVNALSAESLSIIVITTDADADTKIVVNDVKTAIDQVNDLPGDVEIPRIENILNKSRSSIKVAIRGENYDEIRNSAKGLRDKLEESKMVAQVGLDGYFVDEIRVEVDIDKLERFQLSVGQVARAIKERNLNLSAGKLKGKNEIVVRTVSEFTSLGDIENVVVRSNDTGKNVQVKDIAKVSRSPIDEGVIFLRSNGEQAIFLNVEIKEKADVIKSAEFVKTETEKYFKGLGNSSLSYLFSDDSSYYVKRRLGILTENGIIGMTLVFLCLLLFLNTSSSIITSLGAPTAFMTAFLLMGFFGITINLISMFALILVLGMLVDDSIIVAEQYYQYLEQGMEPHEAARKAAFVTLKPVTSTILTTIAAFGALFFMGGTMGKFLWPVPVVVIICLLASWLECFFILPSHLAEFVRLSKKEKSRKWYDVLTDQYRKLIRYMLISPFRTYGLIALFAFILGGAILMAKSMRFELFPGDDVRTVYLQIKGDVSVARDETDGAVRALENLVMEDLKKEELDQVRGAIGALYERNRTKRGNQYGSVIIYLTPPDERERSTDEIVAALTKKAQALVPGYVVSIRKIQGGPPRGKPIEIELTGESLQVLTEASKEVNELLAMQEGVDTTEIDFEEGQLQYVARINEMEAKRLGLSTSQIALELRRALSGDAITEIRESDEDIEIKILLQEKYRKDKEFLRRLKIQNSTGNLIPLSRVIKFDESPGAFVIRRQDYKRIISVTASLNKDKVSPIQITNKIEPNIKKIREKYGENFDYSFGGENKDTKESMLGLAKAGIIAFFCIFIILVTLFNSIIQPIIVYSGIPLSFIGVIIAFKVFGMALGFMALMGVVGLIGVAINDSIVLVDAINRKIEEKHLDTLEAIIEAAVSRFRPVILTTVTTVAGLLPIAHATGGDPFLKPMALSFAYGLMFASVVTLLFVPAQYSLYKNKLFIPRFMGSPPTK